MVSRTHNSDPPAFCHPAAFQLFARQVPRLAETGPLVCGATAVAMHAFPESGPEQVKPRLAELAAKVERRLRSRDPEAVLAHLHDVLFHEEGFRGARRNYYAPANSYLPVVLETRTGLPILLSLVYKSVAERCGLEVEGVNAPCHFLVRVRTRGSWLLVDPFHGGRALTPEEARTLIASAWGDDVGPIPPAEQLLPRASHRAWLGRILANLQQYFAAFGHAADLQAMGELQALLTQAPG